MWKVRRIALVLAVLVAGSAFGQGALTVAAVEEWLAGYGEAWEARDADGVRTLFTEDARYYETPYAEPFEGRAGIGEYWAGVTSDQRGIEFRSSVVSVSGNTAVARWSATFMAGDAAVELDGVFILEFATAGQVAVLREWWHAR